MKPIYLFADSQLLFWRTSGALFLERLKQDVGARSPKAAYIGASNGDQPEFFSIFQAAMEGIGVSDSCMIHAEPSERERAFVDQADLILLAGGDVVRGWRVLERNGVRDAVARRYYEGAVVCGVSAGAVQLGWGAVTGGENGSSRVVGTFRFVPFIVDVHDETGQWKELERAVLEVEPRVKAVGIPLGGGLVFHSEDNSIEPVRRPLHEFTVTDEGLEERLLFSAEEMTDSVTLAGE